MRRARALAVMTLLAAAVVTAGGAGPVGRILRTSHTSSEDPLPVGESKPGNMEHFGIWVDAARQTFARVRDYQCVFTKRERIDGKLQDEQTAQMKVRAEPFSVHVKFTAPRSVSGREASYVAGRLGGKMRARSGGALSLVGYVTLEPTDPKAMQGTRHSITEAGIANLIGRLNQARAAAPGRPAPHVMVAEYTFARRACVRFALTDAAANGVTNQYRTLVYFDKETNLPVRYEAYDRTGDLVESFAYTEIRFNVGLTDAAFP